MPSLPALPKALAARARNDRSNTLPSNPTSLKLHRRQDPRGGNLSAYNRILRRATATPKNTEGQTRFLMSDSNLLWQLQPGTFSNCQLLVDM